MQEPEWIVNDMGELGVKLGNRCFFLYKGDNIEYEDGTHSDGTPIMYRMVGKREFGETCKPDAYYQKGYSKTGRYTEELMFHPGFGPTSGDWTWKPLPSKGDQGKEASTVMKAEDSASCLKDMERLILQYSQETAWDTPDYILAQYFRACLRAFKVAESMYAERCRTIPDQARENGTLIENQVISWGKPEAYIDGDTNANIKHYIEKLRVKCVNDEQLHKAKQDYNFIGVCAYPPDVKQFYNEMGHNCDVRYVLDKKIDVQLSKDVQEFANNINDNLSLTIHTEINKLLLYIRQRGFAPFITPIRIMQEEGMYGMITVVHCFGGYIGKRLAEVVEVIKGFDELNEYQKVAVKIDPEFKPSQQKETPCP
jgi:hypothetical protein